MDRLRGLRNFRETFTTRTALTLLAAFGTVAILVHPPLERAEASWKGKGCVTATGFEPGRIYDSVIASGKSPDLNVVSVRFTDGSTMDFTTPGPIAMQHGDAVEAELSADSSYTGEWGRQLAERKVTDAISGARVIRRRAMLGTDRYSPHLTARLDVTTPQGCANES
jgi:hypothetical protein